MTSLMMMRIQMLPKSQRRTTELWGASFALFLFGVLMPKGERVLLGLRICIGFALLGFMFCPFVRHVELQFVDLVAYLVFHGVRHVLLYLSLLSLMSFIYPLQSLLSYYVLIAYLRLSSRSGGSIKSRGSLAPNVFPCIPITNSNQGTHLGGVPSIFSRPLSCKSCCCHHPPQRGRL